MTKYTIWDGALLIAHKEGYCAAYKTLDREGATHKQAIKLLDQKPGDMAILIAGFTVLAEEI